MRMVCCINTILLRKNHLKNKYLLSSYMVLYILLVCASLYLIYMYYITKQKDETFGVDYIPNDASNVHLNDFKNNKKIITDPCYDAESDNVDKYRNEFFSFQTRINNTSHLNDPVDNINIVGLENPDMIGKNISEIYDELVNSNDYKTYR